MTEDAPSETAPGETAPGETAPGETAPGETAPIATAPFGATGHRSSRVIFGAAALGSMRQDKADEILALLLRHGVNHIDTAASYGESELRVGPWMAEHRDDFFLATKTGRRRGDAARAELEKSLTRLQVDAVDLIQLHNLVEEEEWQIAHGPGGVVEAMVQARDEGLVRHIGVTGHGNRIARMHVRSLAEFPFASVLLPYSYVGLQDPAYRADVDELLAICAARGVAVQTIKSAARRRWPAQSDAKKFSWYEPITEPDAVTHSVRWVLANPQVFLNTTSDARVLPVVLDAAADLRAAAVPSDAELDADVAALGIEPLFDGTDALERI